MMTTTPGKILQKKIYLDIKNLIRGMIVGKKITLFNGSAGLSSNKNDTFSRKNFIAELFSGRLKN